MKIVKAPILAAAVASLICVSVLSHAQQAGKVYKVGFLRAGTPSHPDPASCRLDVGERDCAPSAASHMAFRQNLRELGYVLGQNYVIEYRHARGNRKRLADVAAELVQLDVDVIVTTGSPRAIRAAQRATRTIPIIMTGVTLDPVAAGFVKSLGRPGGNITGLAERQFELRPKRLEILKNAFPQTSTVVTLSAVSERTAANAALITLQETAAFAQGSGIEIRNVVAGPRDRVDAVLTAISEARPDALLVPGINFTVRHMTRIIEFAATRGLPAIYGRTRFADAGGLMSYGVDNVELYRSAATYVDKVLKGAKPADLPVEGPSSFELVINLKTAQQRDLTIPPSVLFKANRVIQ